MGITRHFAQHGAQAEPFGGIVAGGLDASIVEYQRLGPAAFQKQLTILGAIGGGTQVTQGRVVIEGILEGAEGIFGHVHLSVGIQGQLF